MIRSRCWGFRLRGTVRSARRKLIKENSMRKLAGRPIRIAVGGMVLVAVAGMLIGRTGVTSAQDKPASQSSDEAKGDNAKPLKGSAIPPETFVVPAKASIPQLARFIGKIEALRPEFDSDT